jgi:2-oxoisovalerate dehydrogenase E1 component
MTTSVQTKLQDLADKAQAKFACDVYRSMILSRTVDEKMNKLVRQNKGGTFHLSVLGHEMVGAVCGHHLDATCDWGFPYYRDRTFALSFGACPVELFGAFLARELPNHSGGRMMPEHFSSKNPKMPCQSSCVGSQFLQAVGTAWGIKLQNKNEVVYVSAGDGATSQGDFHEALNFASIHSLPIVFVIQDNGWAISVPRSEQTAGGACENFGRGYAGLHTSVVDGCDFAALSKAMEAAVSRARASDGPTLLVAKVPRIGPHSSSDDPKKYKNADQMAEDIKKDPLEAMASYLIENKWLTASDIASMQQEIFDQVEKAAKESEKYPLPNAKLAHTKVFKDSDITEETLTALDGEAVVIMDALNHALSEEMESDEGVIVFGQDVAHGKGGVFGITRTLTEKFGDSRCMNTPLAESTIIGLATGLSFTGFFKPVAEIQFADYCWTGMNQLVNEVASIHYRSNGQWNCPIVIRMPYGGYIQGGPYHSQSIETVFTHFPGIKVVVPSNAEDAKRLLKASIRDPNPVVFFEHKALYRQRAFCAKKEPSKDDVLPLGKANIVREGTDITFIGWGMMVMMGVQVADQLKKEGISMEVIDLRTLNPLDLMTIITSVRKTGKVLIAHEAAKTVGFGAELASKIVEEAFTHLDAPIVRVAAEDCPVPYGKNLEDAILPQIDDLIAAARKLSDY